MADNQRSFLKLLNSTKEFWTWLGLTQISNHPELLDSLEELLDNKSTEVKSIISDPDKK